MHAALAPSDATATYGVIVAEEQPYYSVGELRQQVRDFHHNKRSELRERREARHYYHNDQWTREELLELKKRKQAPITWNRISRKINGIVGLVERTRQDPRAAPRTPQHAHGADIATASIRYVLDSNEWPDLSAEAARDGSLEGIGGLEMSLVERGPNDYDLELHETSSRHFFYDFRSLKPDFSDARYMGVAKWVDVELVKEMVPDKAVEIDGLVASGSDLVLDQDQERKWVSVQGSTRRVFLVEHWYIRQGQWYWCLYTADTMLAQGESPYRDHLDRSISRYIMYSCNVDHDGDRYGFFRNLKDPQDEINGTRSRAKHYLNSRQIIYEEGAVNDINEARRELARPDGAVKKNRNLDFDILDRQFDVASHFQLQSEAKDEVDNFGPNPSLIGQGIENKSGRAIAMLREASIAELGPFMIAIKSWKVRVYRAIWSTIQNYWTGERWIRVTDDEELEELIAINQVAPDARGGLTIRNHLGALDVDIILDEGPDTVSMVDDAYQAIEMLKSQGERVPPEVLIELLPNMPYRTKQKLLKKLEEARRGDPYTDRAREITIAAEEAKVDKTRSETERNRADAAEKAAQARRQDAETRHTEAQTEHTEAETLETIVDIAATTQPQQPALPFDR